jgi:Na+/H+-translocating membrane pyrophosphatase
MMKLETGPEAVTENYEKLFEGIAGYGLGGSTVALFCRVGGGIYTKAADVGADLVSKVTTKKYKKIVKIVKNVKFLLNS